VTLPREGVHHYGPGGEIVEYVPVKDGTVSDTPITDRNRQRPEAMVDDGEVLWAVGADVAEELELELSASRKAHQYALGQVAQGAEIITNLERELAEARRQVEALAALFDNDSACLACPLDGEGRCNQGGSCGEMVKEWAANEARKGGAE